MTIRKRTFPVIVILMIILGWPKSRGGRNQCYDRITFRFQPFDQFIGNLFLLRIRIKYFGTILFSPIGPLTIQLGRIMDFEKKFR